MSHPPGGTADRPLPPGPLKALGRITSELRGLRHPWVISGSVAAGLHGVPVSPGDIDIESTAGGAVEIGLRLAEYTTDPVRWSSTESIRSHFGKFLIFGVPVEVMGDLEIRGPGGWSAPFSAGAGPVLARTPVGPVPIASLAALIEQYRRLGRPDRAQALQDGALAEERS
jgi:hypothetical protein